MTDDQFLRQLIGKELLATRLNLGMDNVAQVEDVKGAPTANTIRNHESGDIATIKALEEHCRALGITMTDLLRSVLNQMDLGVSARALAHARAYDRAESRGRRILEEIVERFAAPPSTHRPDGDLKGRGSRKP